MFFNPCVTQKIEINEYPIGNGFILIQNEEVNLVESYTKLIHAINFTKFQEILDSIIETVGTEKFYKEPTYVNIKEKIDDLLYELTPHFRHRRGIFNLYGSFLKWIGGVMDDDDRQQLELDFKTTKGNLKMLQENVNKQVIVNEKFEQTINSMEKQINEQNKNIVSKIEEIIMLNSQLRKEFENYKLKDIIKENLRYLLNQLEKYENIILNSKLGYLSKNILNSEELHMYRIDTQTLQYIKVAVAQYENSLLIIVQIPKMSENKYFHTSIIPLPNKDTLELNTFVTEVLISHNQIYHLLTVEFDVKKLKLIENICIKNILTNDLKNCTMISNVKETVEMFSSNIIITKNLKKTFIKHTCSDQQIEIQGNNVIKFSNCKINFRNQTFKNNMETKFENIMLPNTIKNISYTNLSNIHLEELHRLHIDNTKKVKLLEYTQIQSNWVSHTKDAILAFLIIIVIAYIYLKTRQSTAITIRQESHPKEGRVTYKKPQSSPDNAAPAIKPDNHKTTTNQETRPTSVDGKYVDATHVKMGFFN